MAQADVVEDLMLAEAILAVNDDDLVTSLGRQAAPGAALQCRRDDHLRTASRNKIGPSAWGCGLSP